jgi:hypothetical protein
VGVIVRLEAAGVVVDDAEACGRLHLQTGLDEAALCTALRTTGTGEVRDDGSVWLDLAVLRSRVQLTARRSGHPDWEQRWAALVGHAERQGRLSPDGQSLRVRVERPARGVSPGQGHS